MNNKLLFILSFFIITQSQVCRTSQLSGMQEILVPHDVVHNQKESAHKKYARYLATTPELDKQLFVKKIPADLLPAIMIFLVGKNFVDTTENYAVWQEEREQKFLSACVAWQPQDIEYIKENLRMDLWLYAFSDLYHHKIDKDIEFEKQLEKIVDQTSDFIHPRPSKLFSMPTYDTQYTLYSYLQQLHPSQCRDEVEIAALMLFSNERAGHYLSRFSSEHIKYLPVESAAKKLQKNYKMLPDINIQNDKGETIAYQAIDYYFIPVIHACIKAGADFNQANKSVYSSKDLETPLNVVQLRALKGPVSVIRDREIFYGIWKILDQAGIKNELQLQVCPSRQALQGELDRAIKDLRYAPFYKNRFELRGFSANLAREMLEESRSAHVPYADHPLNSNTIDDYWREQMNRFGFARYEDTWQYYANLVRDNVAHVNNFILRSVANNRIDCALNRTTEEDRQAHP